MELKRGKNFIVTLVEGGAYDKIPFSIIGVVSWLYMKYYIHSVPGRMRIESPVLHDNPVKAKEFETFIKRLKGISAIEIHASTGSAIIHFDEKINCEQIIGILEKNGYFRLTEAETCDDRVEKTIEKVLEVAEKVIGSVEGGIGE